MKKVTKRAVAFVMSLAMILGACNSTLFVKAVADAATKATITAKKSTVTVTKGKKATLQLKTKNVKKIKSQKWAAKNKKIATVTNKGVVKGVAEGNTTVICTVKYIAKSSKKTQSKKVTFKVKVVADTSATATSTPTATPEVVYYTEPISAEAISLRLKHDDTSNVGIAREVSIKGGTSASMTVKDNGSMRKELSAQYLADNEMGMGIVV